MSDGVIMTFFFTVNCQKDWIIFIKSHTCISFYILLLLNAQYAIHLHLLSLFVLQSEPDIKCNIDEDRLEIKMSLCLCRLVPRIHPEESKCQGERTFSFLLLFQPHSTLMPSLMTVFLLLLYAVD